MARAVVDTCAMCGAHIERGRRVEIKLLWEFEESTHAYQTVIVKRSAKAAQLCRACAYEISNGIGVERPNDWR